MKKAISMIMAVLICISISVFAYADVASFSVICTGGTNVTVPTETATFTVTQDAANPDINKTLTISPDAAGQYIISYPTFTNAGVYKYSIIQNPGNSQGVTYDTGIIGFEILVTYNADNELAVTKSGVSKVNGGAKKTAFENTYAVGNLTINHSVTGNVADQSLQLPFTVAFTAEKTVNTPITYQIFHHDGGVSEFTIASGWTGSKPVTVNLQARDQLIFFKIPVGVTYTITAADNNYGYTTTVTDGTGTITENNTPVVSISSVKNATIDTGINMDSVPYLVILGVAAIGFLISLLRSHRTRENRNG